MTCRRLAALANRLDNAGRYAHGYPVIVRARGVGERVMIRVNDHGPGIPRSEQGRIFEPFYRSRRERARRIRPGLGDRQGLIEVSGGHISVESTPGQGTSFIVELPASAAVTA